MTPDEEQKMYDATRRVSWWMVSLLECEVIAEPCRAALTSWIGAIPESWWDRFPADDAKEAGPCGSAN